VLYRNGRVRKRHGSRGRTVEGIQGFLPPDKRTRQGICGLLLLVLAPIADFISKSEELRQIVRGILWPLVLAVKNPTAAVAVIVTALSLGILCGFGRGRKRRPERRITLPASRRSLLFRREA
jgi:hypothetical protein